MDDRIDRRFSWGRVLAVLLKELIQLRRDRLTFAMLIAVPIMQLVLFGYAINGDPRQLPTALVALDDGPLVRSIVRAAENTGYFRITAQVSEAQAEELVQSSLLNDLMQRAFSGSAFDLVQRALDSTKTSPEELEAISKLIAKAKAKAKRKKK